MTLVDILIYSILGISIVFLALCLLIAIIKILTLVMPAEKPTAPAPKAAAPAAPAEEAKPTGPVAPGSAGDLKLYDTDPRDAAMIMAIIADELGKPLNELRFISIKEVTD